MAIIELTTLIKAPRERVFDLSRSIDAHTASAEGTGEKAIAGVTSGLIGENQQVTWEARHLGIRQHLTVRITQVDRPNSFHDEMLKGAFKSMKHDHVFKEHPEGTELYDYFEFHSPFWILGSFVDWIFLKAYMRKFLVKRNEILKRMCESDEWKKFLPDGK